MKVYIVMVHDKEDWWPLDVFSSSYDAEEEIKECIGKEGLSGYRFKIVVRELF